MLIAKMLCTQPKDRAEISEIVEVSKIMKDSCAFQPPPFGPASLQPSFSITQNLKINDDNLDQDPKEDLQQIVTKEGHEEGKESNSDKKNEGEEVKHQTNGVSTLSFQSST